MYFYFKSGAPVRRAQLRQGGPGSIVESVVPDPDLRYREAEKAMLDAAKENGVTDKNIEITGDPAKPKGRGLVSYPGAPARAKTRRDSD